MCVDVLCELEVGVRLCMFERLHFYSMSVVCVYERVFVSILNMYVCKFVCVCLSLCV